MDKTDVEYVVVGGVRKGSEHKLPRMYEVVKRAQERNVAESTFALVPVREELPD